MVYGYCPECRKIREMYTLTVPRYITEENRMTVPVWCRACSWSFYIEVKYEYETLY